MGWARLRRTWLRNVTLRAVFLYEVHNIWRVTVRVSCQTRLFYDYCVFKWRVLTLVPLHGNECYITAARWHTVTWSLPLSLSRTRSPTCDSHTFTVLWFLPTGFWVEILRRGAVEVSQTHVSWTKFWLKFVFMYSLGWNVSFIVLVLRLHCLLLIGNAASL